MPLRPLLEAALILLLCSNPLRATPPPSAQPADVPASGDATDARPAWRRPYALARLNAEGVPPLIVKGQSREAWTAKRAEIARVWQETMGALPPRVPTHFVVQGETEERDHVRLKIVFDAVEGERIPAFLLVPKGARESGRRSPAVLALHPTNAIGKTSVATSQGIKNRMYGYELVSRGYVVLAPDDLTSGERIYPGLASFRSAPFYARHPEWSTVARNLVDHLQAVDLLVSLPYVDPACIGVIGHSFGGYNAYFLSGADERVRTVVSSCGVCPFTLNPEPGHWGVRDWYTHLPKITPALQRGEVPFEFNEIIALSAPRPMFFYTAQADHIFPHWRGVGECLLDVHRLYQFLGAEDQFTSVMGVGDHDFPEPIRKMAYDFLDAVLKRAPAAR